MTLKRSLLTAAGVYAAWTALHIAARGTLPPSATWLLERTPLGLDQLLLKIPGFGAVYTRTLESTTPGIGTQ